MRYSLDSIRLGFERFHKEFGHYPTAPEIDRCDFLPSSRQIQRKFGGLRNLRANLGLDISDYGKGEFRKNIAKRSNMMANITEGNVRLFLNNHFGEICVHEEKKFGDKRNRVDFFVYADRNFGVEVFNTYTLHDLAKNLNMKLPRFYRFFENDLYFVVTGSDFSQEDIDSLVFRKKHLLLLANMFCMTFLTFQQKCLERHKPIKVMADYMHIFKQL